MGIIDANVKTSKCEKQFFQTLPEQVEALAWFLKKKEEEGYCFDKILDAGSGKNVISDNLKSQGYGVTTIDKYFPADINADFLEHDFEKSFHVVASNPPYKGKEKYEFIEKALKISLNCFFLLPLQILNYIEFCEYLDKKEEYMGRLTLYPKVILNPDGKLIQGGNTGYGWFWLSNSKRDGYPFEIFIDTRKYRKQLNITSV